MKIELSQPLKIRGKNYQTGDVVELDDSEAQMLVDIGCATNTRALDSATRSMPSEDAAAVARMFGGVVLR